MKRSQLLILAVAVIAVVAAVALRGGDGEDASGESTAATAPKGALAIPFVYSPEKEKFLKPLIRRFNNTAPEVGGKPVFVEGEVISSGEAEERIARKDLRRHRRCGRGCSTSTPIAPTPSRRTPRSCGLRSS